MKSVYDMTYEAILAEMDAIESLKHDRMVAAGADQPSKSMYPEDDEEFYTYELIMMWRNQFLSTEEVERWMLLEGEGQTRGAERMEMARQRAQEKRRERSAHRLSPCFNF